MQVSFHINFLIFVKFLSTAINDEEMIRMVPGPLFLPWAERNLESGQCLRNGPAISRLWAAWHAWLVSTTGMDCAACMHRRFEIEQGYRGIFSVGAVSSLRPSHFEVLGGVNAHGLWRLLGQPVV
jgi:hypothetical protein